VIETNKELNPNQANQPSYTRNIEYNGITAVRVTTYNEYLEGSDDDDFFVGENSSWNNGEKVEINIEIQLCEPVNGICNSWDTIPSKRIKISFEGNIFKMETQIPISRSKKNKKNKRQFKHEDEYNNEIIRFKSVSITNKTTGNVIKNYPEDEDEDERYTREYIIAFYD